MIKRANLYVMTVLLALGLAGCGKKSAPEPTPSPMPVGDLQVIDQKDIGGTIDGKMALSPNGRWLAGVNQNGEMCIHDADTLAQKHCVTLAACEADPLSFSWSPDSQRLALTEDYRSYRESDLWVLDVESGNSINLTDDGASACEDTSDTAPLPDIWPVWSPDGQALVFFRKEGEELSPYRIAVTGDAPEKLPMDIPFNTDMVWFGDDARFLFSPPAIPKYEQGLWIVEGEDQAPRRLVEVSPELGPAVVMDVSAALDKALVFFRLAGQGDYFSQPNVALSAVVDLGTGELSPLKPAAADVSEFFGPTDATFSPDGSKILYAYRDDKERTRLAVRDVDGGSDKVLLALDSDEVFFRHGLNLNWAEDDTVLLPDSQLLLSLGYP